MKTCLLRFAVCLLLWPGAAAATVTHEQCRIVRFSDLGEPDLVIKTAAAAVVLEALGYTPQTQPFSKDETFASLVNGEIDVFLGADRRKMDKQLARLADLGAVQTLGINQTPEPQEPALAAAGTGEGGVDKTGEAGGKPDEDDQSAAGIETLARAGFAEACPNAGTFLRNLTFPPGMTVFIATRMATEYEELFDAAVAWFDVNRDILDVWLAGVKTTKDGDAKAAVLQDFGF